MKYVILGAILFVFYRFMYKPSLLEKAKDRETIEDNAETNNEEFTDYEEID